jgi:hypothetical protein
MGGTWPKYFVLKGVDHFTVATCHAKESDAGIIAKGIVYFSC